MLVDLYSDYFEIEKINSTTSNTIIRFCKTAFARHGVPNAVISDNGPQIASNEFKAFAKEWNFTHITSSPYHSQANGKAEATVKIAKQMLMKCKSSGEYPYKALLDLRNTPIQGMRSSPVQRLMSRRTQGLIHTNKQLLKPVAQSNVREKIQKSGLKLKDV